MLCARDMGHPLRWFLPGVVYEITTRTIQERYLLRPTPGVRELIIGVLARGSLFYPNVYIHGFAFLSNHYHLLASADDGHQLARFVGYVNSNIAREVSRVHSWSGPFWGRRHRPIPIVDDEAAIARLRYVLSQGVKEGLVRRPEEWPGATSIPWLLGGMLSGTWIYRDVQRRARRSPRDVAPASYTEHYELELSPLPCWRNLSRDELARLVTRLLDDVAGEARAQRGERRVVGVDALLTTPPHDRPANLEGRAAPPCHASSQRIRSAFRAAYNAFTRAFRDAAAAAKRTGAVVVSSFPPGCFPSPLSFVPCKTLALPWLFAPFTTSGLGDERPTWSTDGRRTGTARGVS